MLFLNIDSLLTNAIPDSVIISMSINDSLSPFALGPLPLLSSFTNPHPPPEISESPALLADRLLLLLLLLNVVALAELDCEEAFPAAS